VLVVCILLACTTAATLTKALWNNVFDDFKGTGQTLSGGIQEARKRGTLVAELDVQPNELTVAGRTVRFHEAWLEERSLATHSLVWFPSNKRVGGFNLCFTLAEGDEAFYDVVKCFVVNDKQASVTSIWSYGARPLFVEPLDKPDVSEIRVSLITSWKEVRAKNIRFSPKARP
jgi:hypothetical protein